MVLFAFSILMYAGIEQGASFYINTRTRTITSAEIIDSITFSAFWSSMIAGRFLCGYASKKFDGKKIIITLTAFSAAALGTVIFSQGYIWATGFFLLGLGLSGIWPLSIDLGSTRFRHYAAIASVIMFCLTWALKKL